MANSTASVYIKPTVAFNRGDTFVFGAWVCTADGAGSFQRRLTMPPNPETGLVALPEVVTGELAGKFGEISLFNQHADFELGSTSNSNSTSPWAIVCESATEPSHVDSPPRERFTRAPRNVSRAHTKAPTTRRAGKEPVPEYDSDSDTAPGYNSDSNPLSGFYSDSAYEFDFGSDPEEPEFEDNSTEEPLSGPAAGLVITSTPTGKICLLARPQACRLDRRELTLRHLPRLTPVPGGNTACSSWGAHSYRGGNQRLQPWLSRPASLHDYQRDARALGDGP
jgi:hypothetical protein